MVIKQVHYIKKRVPYTDIRYDSKEAMLFDFGITFDTLSDYFSFLKEHSTFSTLRLYACTRRYQEIPDENIQSFSSDVLEKIKSGNAFLNKINKSIATFRFVDFVERMSRMLLGDAVAICFSPDIELAKLPQEELSVLDFK
jgi:hypothetical protein